MQKNEKEGKVSPFIGPRKIKSKLLDYVQYKLTARGSEKDRLLGLKAFSKIQTNGRDMDEVKRRIPK